MKPGGKGDQSRRNDGADRTVSVWMSSLGRDDARNADRKERAPDRVMRKLRQPSRK